MDKKPFIIAELCCNHKGDMRIAKDMIKSAAYCKADVAKFQKRNNRELLSPEQYNAPHPNPVQSYGSTYGEHREFLEFTLEQHSELKACCEEYGIIYSSSVWDMTSAKEIASLNPCLIKIPSACNTNLSLLTWLCKNYCGEIHISFGMTNQAEEKGIIDLFTKLDRSKDLVLYACTSGYPVPYEDISLREITRLTDTYGGQVKAIGFSGHHIGIAPDIAAYALGAHFFERHFTLDKAWKGTDHAASLEPNELASLVDSLNQTFLAMRYKESEILPIEQIQREKLKYKG